MKSDSESLGEKRSTKDAANEALEQSSDSQQPTAAIRAPYPERPHPPYHYKVTYKAKKGWWDKTKPIIEVAGVILLAVYTFYTVRMYRANKDAADAAKSAADTAHDALTLDERAWVSFSGLRKDYATKGEFLASEIINTGKTPARDVTFASGIFVYPGRIALSDKEAMLMEQILTQSPVWCDNVRINRQLTDDRKLAELFTPDRPGPLPSGPNEQRMEYTYAPTFAPRSIVGRSMLAPRKYRVGPLSPNGEYPLPAAILSTSFSSSEPNDSDVVFGLIIYRDIFNFERVTRFCAIRPPGRPLFEPCPVYNDMN